MLKTRLLSMQNLGVNHHENEHSCIVLSMRQLKLKLNLPKWIHFPIFPISARNLWHFSRYRFLPAAPTRGTSNVKLHCSVGWKTMERWLLPFDTFVKVDLWRFHIEWFAHLGYWNCMHTYLLLIWLKIISDPQLSDNASLTFYCENGGRSPKISGGGRAEQEKTSTTDPRSQW